MAGAISGLAYPDRFYATAAYAGFDGSPNPSNKDIVSMFSNDTALILYALYQQATVGPYNNNKTLFPYAMGKGGEVMSLVRAKFFKSDLNQSSHFCLDRPLLLVPSTVIDSTLLTASDGCRLRTCSNHRSLPTLNFSNTDTIPKDILIAEFGVMSHRVLPHTHRSILISAASILLTWQQLGKMVSTEAMRLFVKILEEEEPGWFSRASNSGLEPVTDVQFNHNSNVEPIIENGNSFIEITTITAENGGLMETQDKDVVPEGLGSVVVYDQWISPPITGQRPKGRYELARGGQSVTLVGRILVIFGGQDAKLTLRNDLHIPDLKTLTWDEIDSVGVPPSLRSGHAAAVHAERYLLIFGGGSHATCFNDLHVFDLQTMEWSIPRQQGEIPTPRAGHAGVTVGENWFIVGGGDNKSESRLGVSSSKVVLGSVLTSTSASCL
ncbi:Acyl-CoA-binding domain-containing protein 5 [Hibiscus syriacus]|uniref:Acyl-CoA-binding domain-containing protein 5 n=1 Tax=Hibiscus syriacus TaxID=106335 RepID=A0A6A2YGH9_HIBSY|nr:Acyl-CoA-binding domain-containing protein 5 [Hibiscus syriacus]